MEQSSSYTSLELMTIIRSGEIFLFWCTNSALFRLCQMVLSIVLLVIVADAKIPLRHWEHFLLTSTAGCSPVISTLLVSGYLVGKPAPPFMEVCFGLIEMIGQATCLAMIMNAYNGNKDPHADRDKQIACILAVLIVSHLGDALCYVGCRNYKNCCYVCVSKRNSSMIGRG